MLVVSPHMLSRTLRVAVSSHRSRYRISYYEGYCSGWRSAQLPTESISSGWHHPTPQYPVPHPEKLKSDLP